MSTVASRDTKPEWILRCGLHRLGFRYRLNNRCLPGRPDLLFPKYKSVVFVHGCYWHRHPGCKDASLPKSNREFWSRKFDENTARDRRAASDLCAAGFRVLVVWECELIRQTIETIERVACWLGQEKAAADSVQRKQLLMAAEEKIRYRIDRPEKRKS